MPTPAAVKPAETQEELTERDVRVQLAACYRLIAHFGMDDLVYTHISARVPGPERECVSCTNGFEMPASRYFSAR